eukprot:scaffold117817_cov15-Prasinocladus_malaysianus.AAC.1
MLMLKPSRLSSTQYKSGWSPVRGGVHLSCHLVTQRLVGAASVSSEATEAEAGSAAARTLVTGDFLGEIVALHRLVYGSDPTQHVGTVVVVGGELTGRWVDAWARGYQLGQAMLRHCEAAGHRPPAE